MITTRTGFRSPRHQLLIPAGLILLTLIPILAGAFRLAQLGGGPEVVPEQARFTDSPFPLVLHIVGATLFSVIGAFQFLPALREGRLPWHRTAGPVLIAAGMIAALSGLWMAVYYPHPIGDGGLLLLFRLIFGCYMFVSLVLAVRALILRNFASHGAWMTRGYALGVAAGTQSLALIPGSIVFGATHEFSRAVAIGGAWVINLAIAEIIIQRRHGAQSRPRSKGVVMTHLQSYNTEPEELARITRGEMSGWTLWR